MLTLGFRTQDKASYLNLLTKFKRYVINETKNTYFKSIFIYEKNIFKGCPHLAEQVISDEGRQGDLSEVAGKRFFL